MNKKFSTLLLGGLLLAAPTFAEETAAPEWNDGKGMDGFSYEEVADGSGWFVMTATVGESAKALRWDVNKGSGKDSLAFVADDWDWATVPFAKLDSALWKIERKAGPGSPFKIKNKATGQYLAISSDWKNRKAVLVSPSAANAVSEFSVAPTGPDDNQAYAWNVAYATFGAKADSLIYLTLDESSNLGVGACSVNAETKLEGAMKFNYFHKPVVRRLSGKDLNDQLNGRGFQLFFHYNDVAKTENNPLVGKIFKAYKVTSAETESALIGHELAGDNDYDVMMGAEAIAPKFSTQANQDVAKKYSYAFVDTVSFDKTFKSENGTKLVFKVDTIPSVNGGRKLSAQKIGSSSYIFNFYKDPAAEKDSIAVFVRGSYNLTEKNGERTFSCLPAAKATTDDNEESTLESWPLQLFPLVGTSTDKMVLATGDSTDICKYTRISLTGDAIAPMFDTDKVWSVKNVNEAVDAENAGKYMVAGWTSAAEQNKAYADAVYAHLPSTQFVFDGAQMVNREVASVVTKALYAVEGKTDIYTNLTDTFEIKAMANVDVEDATIGWASFSEDSLKNYAFSLDYISGILEGRSIDWTADSVVVATTEGGAFFKLKESDDAVEVDGGSTDDVVAVTKQAYTLQTKDGKYVVVSDGKKGLVLTSVKSGKTATAFYLKDTEEKGQFILVREDDGTTVKYNVNSTNEALEAVGMNLQNNAFAVQVESAPEYVLDAKGHYNIENLRGDMLAADAQGFGMFRKEGELKAAYGKEDFALWIDTAKIHPTKPSYFILSGAKAEKGSSKLEGNFLRVMSDSTGVEGYKAANGWTRLAFVPAKREATSDSLLVNYQNETLVKADSVDYKGKNSDKIDQFRFYIQYTNNEGEYIVENDKGYLATYNDVLCLLKSEDKTANEPLLVKLTQVSAPTANEGVEVSAVTVIAGEGQVTIAGAAGKKVVISNILGQTVANTVIASDNAVIAAPQGVVVVAVEGEEAVKAIVK